MIEGENSSLCLGRQHSLGQQGQLSVTSNTVDVSADQVAFRRRFYQSKPEAAEASPAYFYNVVYKIKLYIYIYIKRKLNKKREQ